LSTAQPLPARDVVDSAFVRASWYCAAWSAELADKPLGRHILGMPLVIYRDTGGKPVALTGRCAHRFAPLAQGVVVGDEIQCRYHGLRYGPDGRCTLNPNGDGYIPSNARLRSFPIREHQGALWVWMGDADAADPAQIPSFPFLQDSGYSVKTGYLSVQANYQLVIDNLLDLSHAQYLHASTLATFSPDPERKPQLDHSFRQEGREVVSEYRLRGVAASPLMRSLFPLAIGDRISRIRWFPPSNLKLDSELVPEGTDGGGLHLPSLHLLTPETKTSTHYFFVIGRNARVDDREEDEKMLMLVKRAFETEDEPMLRSCQEMMGTTDLMSCDPVLLKTDVAAVRARRVIKELLDEQNREG